MKEKMMPASCAGKPFVKWAGGKSKLLPVIQAKLPHDFESYHTYVEPFTGGGAVFFRIKQCYPGKRFVLNDFNEKLVLLYRIVRDHPEAFIQKLLEKQNRNYQLMNLEEQKLYFLEQRALYNKNSSNEMKMAALMLFLNKTCFNGLYRENRQGIFNVSFANLKRPSICSPELIRKDSELLQGVTLMCGDYRQTESFAEKGYFFYFDPPYKPISKTSSFTCYTKHDFGDDEQIGLAQFCSAIRQKGACWMQSMTLCVCIPYRGNDRMGYFLILTVTGKYCRKFANESRNTCY
jgi:DNA adenine methylase